MKPKILTTMREYSPALFRADLIAGITVAMVALPLSLAIAIASGAPPSTGIITAVVGGFLISLLGGSRVQIGGPTGAFIVVVYDVIATHGLSGLILATLMAGLILIAAALLKAGNLIRLVPEPVINGFTIGIAIIIGTSQLKDFFGLQIENLPAEFFPKIEALWTARDTLSGAALAVGLGTLALILILRRLLPRFPGLIVAVGVTSALALLAGMPVETITSRFGELPRGLPMPSLPQMNLALVSELLPSALIIAFLAGIESLLSAMVADRMIAGKHRPNAELMAQGFANIGSSLFGGLPATGAIARTATNIRAGGKTPVAGLVHALTVLLVMLIAAPVAGRLALPALAALLMLTAWNMAEPHRWRSYLAERRSDLFLMILTMVLTVVADLTIAIGTGVGVGLALRLQRRDVPPADWTPPDR
ncbi:MAG TPA: SulP family inorganic anion transporter [Paracoccus sp. (in: a-proteobacteria)]|uniref:SulP family inorganic anion transporter n=1 Tax=uncultured Paracoccus sp. TaxID=189685 RepID=UPI002632D283|nr:SulP family inorganic anion transporter [uncultured Paracoccus sp.]HMQ41576.1 SulP family inorganic anion transporter [Paracoccus sp. (in: a-proteobacteria)]HMR36959.1 SulP family inorganic anion transporter [Paracoccus sp. (in: a-proteobacteria)]